MVIDNRKKCFTTKMEKQFIEWANYENLSFYIAQKKI
jgi:hypothetical protein